MIRFHDAIFSFHLKVVSPDATPPVVSASAHCDRCGAQFDVLSPSDAAALLDRAAHHMLQQCTGGEAPS